MAPDEITKLIAAARSFGPCPDYQEIGSLSQLVEWWQGAFARLAVRTGSICRICYSPDPMDGLCCGCHAAEIELDRNR